MYVNWDMSERARPFSTVYATHQWVSCLPTQFLSQKLDYSLKPVRRSDLVEVLLHDWRIPNSFEAYDDCSDVSQQQRTTTSRSHLSLDLSSYTSLEQKGPPRVSGWLLDEPMKAVI